MSFQFVVAEEVYGAFSDINFVLHFGLERMRDEAHFNIRVGGKVLLAVHSAHVETPLFDLTDFVLQIP